MNFSHGGDVKSFALQIGCDVDEVVDLSSNINFLKPEKDIDFNSLNISGYPTYDILYEKISKLYGINSEQLELFNGGSSAIFSLLRLFETRHIHIYSPAYLEYKKAATKLNYTIELINRFTDLDKFVAPNSLVVFVNPSTPEGSFYDMDSLMKKWIEKKCTILIDESFLDFTSFESVIKYLKTYEDIYILKSMTKFYSSAGIRVGGVISSKNNIKQLKNLEPVWKISQFDSHYIQAVLEDKRFPKISKAVNIANKELLKNILKQSRYISHIFPSSANFVLVQLKGLDAVEFQNLLKEYKIMVRNCTNFDFLDGSFVRIAVKSKEHIDLLKKALTTMENNCI